MVVYEEALLLPPVVILRNFHMLADPESFIPFFMTTYSPNDSSEGTTIVVFSVCSSSFRTSNFNYGKIVTSRDINDPIVIVGNSEILERVREAVFPSHSLRPYTKHGPTFNRFLFEHGIKAVAGSLNPQEFDPYMSWEEDIRKNTLDSRNTERFQFQLGNYNFLNHIEKFGY
jgi:hypothetical protein